MPDYWLITDIGNAMNLAECPPLGGDNDNALRHIVIVGGGSAGWITAAMLAAQLPAERCRIELVESDDISMIGVGESTLPPFVRLLQKLGIDERDFVEQTQGCYKLGIQFEDWRACQQSYFHPFGQIGRAIHNQDFYQCWLKAVRLGEASPLMAYSPCAALAQAQRIHTPASSNGLSSGASYALHIDAALAVDYFRRYAIERGVQHRIAKVVGAERRGNGHIAALHLATGETLGGDFFMDCTGFRARLIEGELGAGYEDWSDSLLCDRSVFVKTEVKGPLVPYTRAIARQAGWGWRIPLRNSTGHGYVYSSRHCTDAQAKSTLMRHLDALRINDPRVVSFRPGYRPQAWTHNCLAVGLSSGFVEPLESTSIHLIARSVAFFLRYLPGRDCHPALAREFNRRMRADFEEVRDFILLHYVTSERRDSAFWRDCAELPIPDSLRERIELFRASGLLRDGVDELFRATSWQAVFEGMGIRPERCSPALEGMSTEVLHRALRSTQAAVQSVVQTGLRHEQVLPEAVASSLS